MFDLNLEFKGQRDYLHGTDMFSSITAILAKKFGGHVERLTIRRVASRQLRLRLDEMPENAAGVASGVWRAKDAHDFWLEETTEPVLGRYPYDENRIVASASLSGETLSADRVADFSAIETVVAMTKELNVKLSPDIKGQWYFGQIDLSRSFPKDWSRITIRRHAFIRDVFSRNLVDIDGDSFGEIRFVVGPA